MSMFPGVHYYVDDDGVLHVEVDGEEIATEDGCENLSKQAIDDLVYEILNEYGYL